MMFYQDDDDDDDDEDIVTNVPSSASRVSFFKQQEVDGTRIITSAAASTSLVLPTDIALWLAATLVVVSNDDYPKNDTNDTDKYGIFLSFSENENEDHQYNDCASSPSFKYNVFRDPTTITAQFVTVTAGRDRSRGRGRGRGRGQQYWLE